MLVWRMWQIIVNRHFQRLRQIFDIYLKVTEYVCWRSLNVFDRNFCGHVSTNVWEKHCTCECAYMYACMPVMYVHMCLHVCIYANIPMFPAHSWIVSISAQLDCVYFCTAELCLFLHSSIVSISAQLDCVYFCTARLCLFLHTESSHFCRYIYMCIFDIRGLHICSCVFVCKLVCMFCNDCTCMNDMW
jgi:hypothetical protein